jgi:hypothetical protein
MHDAQRSLQIRLSIRLGAHDSALSPDRKHANYFALDQIVRLGVVPGDVIAV